MRLGHVLNTRVAASTRCTLLRAHPSAAPQTLQLHYAGRLNENGMFGGNQKKESGGGVGGRAFGCLFPPVRGCSARALFREGTPLTPLCASCCFAC